MLIIQKNRLIYFYFYYYMCLKLISFCLILVFLLFLEIKKNKEYFSSHKKDLFNNMMNNHYNNIFPNNANRNAAGFRFFQYIYDNLADTEELFDIYNQFYCAVSGSIVSPERQNNYSILKVGDKNNKCIIGKYYRCCTPCDCDIMKYVSVINTKIEMPKNSGNYIYRNLLTIGDPCLNESAFPNEIDRNVFTCSNKLLKNAYRVNDMNELTKKTEDW